MATATRNRTGKGAGMNKATTKSRPKAATASRRTTKSRGAKAGG